MKAILLTLVSLIVDLTFSFCQNSKSLSCIILSEASSTNEVFNLAELKGQEIYLVDTFGFFDSTCVPETKFGKLHITRSKFRKYSLDRYILVSFIGTRDSALAIQFFYPQTGLSVMQYFSIRGTSVNTIKKTVGNF
jgi:hypothetical protein